MKYVLIFMVLTQEFGSVSVTAEFDTLAACETVNKDLRAVHSRAFDSEPHNAYVHGKCCPEGA